MSPWESFFSSRIWRRRSPIIMDGLFHWSVEKASNISCGKYLNGCSRIVFRKMNRFGKMARWKTRIIPVTHLWNYRLAVSYAKCGFGFTLGCATFQKSAQQSLSKKKTNGSIFQQRDWHKSKTTTQYRVCSRYSHWLRFMDFRFTRF